MSTTNLTPTTLSASQLNDLAKNLKSLHVSGQPLLLANVWDASSAQTIASQHSTKALATASYAVAMMVGVEDASLNLALNLAGISYAAAGLRKAGKEASIPLSADLQDGYGEPAETIRQAIRLGVVGCNLEDCYTDSPEPKLRSIEESVQRIKGVLAAAKEAGVPDFVVNARTDTFGKMGGSVEEVIERGNAYLEAGATTVFVWGVGKHDITADDVTKMVDAFGGRLAVQPGSLGIKKLRELGAARISVGPMLWRKATEVVKQEGLDVLEA
jgi:2-methylisocitrate lyase-like PEP mutase family enzyme